MNGVQIPNKPKMHTYPTFSRKFTSPLKTGSTQSVDKPAPQSSAQSPAQVPPPDTKDVKSNDESTQEKPNDQSASREEIKEPEQQTVQQSETHPEKQTEVQPEKQIDKQTDCQTENQTDKQPEQKKEQQQTEKTNLSEEKKLLEFYDEYNCYKLCGQAIVKLHPDGKNEKVYTIQTDVLCPKMVQVSPTKVYLIGGASDVKFNNTLKSIYLLDFASSPVRLEEKAKMNTPRCSHGVCLSKDKKKIYVCGGNSEPQKMLKSCECYNIDKDIWTPLPDLNMPKFAMGICEYVNTENKGWIYCFGGVGHKKTESGANGSGVIDEIEKLSLGNDDSSCFWEVLNQKLLTPACDLTCKQISETVISISGGWNRIALNEVSFLNTQSETISK